MQEESLVSGQIEGIIDVGVLVPSCFENPLKEDSIMFVHEALIGARAAILPVSAIFGAYHIVTRYLRVPSVTTRRVLAELLNTNSRALYPEISIRDASLALDYASAHSIESWDGYLIALAKKFESKKIFSLDEDLAKTLRKIHNEADLLIQNPFESERVRQYHRFLKKSLK